MWSYEYSADTSATPEAIWPFFEDVAGWPTWNQGIEHIVLEGPFTTGSTFLMTPPGSRPFAANSSTSALPKVSATSPNSTGSR